MLQFLARNVFSASSSTISWPPLRDCRFEVLCTSSPRPSALATELLTNASCLSCFSLRRCYFFSARGFLMLLVISSETSFTPPGGNLRRSPMSSSSPQLPALPECTETAHSQALSMRVYCLRACESHRSFEYVDQAQRWVLPPSCFPSPLFPSRHQRCDEAHCCDRQLPPSFYQHFSRQPGSAFVLEHGTSPFVGCSQCERLGSLTPCDET